MREYDVTCPSCGTVNKGLFLEETEGNYECEGCGKMGRLSEYQRRLNALREGNKGKKGSGPEKMTPLTV